ncbi:CAMK/CAMKL protein kinase [Puccinia triticina 1-1 BBBD Race 1]|uniref:CAMK/CAMKL protein kinase n=2 Tax=Puccinia triticina TaxID=208348 RepID=A0A180H4Q7_PUCT1|nr:uncharacterized protein PtA15_9A301 [Puccinia triticina]OAV99945.1 CAMK/CAMKL protein kinase [Puccinia triticina 1-1 BBBD Race 1]WAQ88176.1 hypothetical protein PtA15_9A301 [Puccinia triticina]WAR60364.1 hypothetical protein PtB15_9B303 [Puccinia triticina]
MSSQHNIQAPSAPTSSSSLRSSVSSTNPSRRLSTSTSALPSSRSAKSSTTSQESPQANLPHDIFTITDEALAAQYTFESEIGYGNWGSIWRIAPNNPSNRLHSSSKLAIKLVYRDKSSGTTATKIKSLWSEFKILRLFKRCPHPNVLRVSSFIITPSYALMTMAFHPAILNVRLGERTPRVRRYIRGLLEGTEFLHRSGVSHNDIKPANVVLSAEDEPVLIDFGFAAAYPPDYTETTGKKPFWSTLSWGTPEYLSPQRAKSEGHDERLSDIWSLGVTLYELVVGRTPFELNEKEEFLSKEALEVYYQRTLKAEFLGPHTLSSELKQLLVSMLRPDPKERLQSCSAALAHSFFQRPLSSDMTIRQRTIERSLPSSVLRSPPEPAATLVTRRVQQLSFQSRSRSNSITSASSPSSRRPGTNITPTKSRPKAVFEDLQSTPKSGSRKNRVTPTRPVLAAKSLNTPNTPRQNRVPVPDCEVKKSAAVKTVTSPPRSMPRKRVPVSPKSDSSKKTIMSPRVSHAKKVPVHRPTLLQPMKEN